MGSKRKIHESFLGLEICRSIVAFFIFPPKIVKVLILFHKFLHENGIQRKKGAHHEKADGKSFETVNSYFRVPKLCHRDFSPEICIKSKILKIANTFKTCRFCDHIVSTSSTTNLMGKTNPHCLMNVSKTFITLLRDFLFKI